MSNACPRFAIVAGEDSGDILGADLISALKKIYPNAIFEGIGGHRMRAQGFHSFYPLDRLSVMGLFEPLKRLPELLKIFFHIKKYCLSHKPTAFIGIDAPDFNLRLEKILKKKGIKTVHYVSPTVWAWRANRIHSIKQSTDLMLGLFPFEEPIYQKNQVPYAYVGHPLADEIPLHSSQKDARQRLQLGEGKYVAILPGSRRQELRYLLEPFLATAQWLYQQDRSIRFVTACVNEEREQQFREMALNFPELPIEIFRGRSLDVMAASDAVLLASGTASLQSMLTKKPTVVAYRMSELTYQIAKRIIHVPYIALPNLLANKSLMPEFIQNDVQPDKMGQVILNWLNAPTSFENILIEFDKIHHVLRKNAGMSAAAAIASLVND